MKTIYLIRHAHSSRSNFYMLEDHERPLDERGKSEATVLAKLLKDKNIKPEFTLCSTAKRTKETYSFFTEYFSSIPLSLSKTLYLASSFILQNEIAAIPNEFSTCFLIGHNSGLSDLVSAILERPVDLPTCSFTQIEFPVDDWKDINLRDAKITASFTAKDLLE
jgi:phosphohistidine phosphatase